MTMRRTTILGIATLLTFIASAVTTTTYAATTKPQLVINIVAGTLRADDLNRYSNNFCEGGLRRLMDNGVVCTNSVHDYLFTTTPAALATFATGAQPSVHGITNDFWWSYVDSSKVWLIKDDKYQSVPYSTGSDNYSPSRLSAHTIGDMLIAQSPKSKLYTVAVDAISAIVLNGKAGMAFWAETNQTHWTTSSYYAESLPQWINEYNRRDSNRFYKLRRWMPYYVSSSYLNSEVSLIKEIRAKSTKSITGIDPKIIDSDFGQMCYTPAGNSMVLNFARNIITFEELGRDSDTDVINICLDTTRYIAELYGPESIEYEDMIYRLDADIEKFLNAVYELVDPSQVVVTFSACHGTSPSYNPVGGVERDRFNSRQMEVIVNAFLGARYGSDSYILGSHNNAIYLNHELILSKRLSLETIREEVAVFLLQLRGVASAYPATALRYTSFAEGRSRLAQQSFHAARSGDVIIDLMPGWIIEEGNIRSSSLSGYGYDKRIPLIIYGGGISAKQVERVVKSTELAPTLARIMQLETPWASEELPMREVE